MIRTYKPGDIIAHVQEQGNDLYIVQEGTVEVWNDPSATSANMSEERRLVATLLPGQITGELALLDGGRRSADLRAGEEGATVMILGRDRLVVLSEDDPPLGIRLIWNIATALALRLRLTNLQLQMANKAFTEQTDDQKPDNERSVTREETRDETVVIEEQPVVE
jgi:CRP-like cAMP-binding protein